MNINQVEIRPMQAAELDTVIAMRAAGFGGTAEQTMERFKRNPRYNESHIWVADYSGQLVGTTTVFPAKMWLSGVPLDVGAVAGVTVPEAHRRQGIAAKMMESAVVQMHADDFALSVLFPFSHKYYNKFGYAPVSDLHAYRIAPQNIAVTGDSAKVRPFAPDDLPMLRVVYKGQMTWHNGWFTRSNAWWDRIIERWTNLVVFDNDDMIDGYCFFNISADSSGRRVLKIHEFFAGEPEAYQGLLAFLAEQDADVIDYLAPADTPLRHSLKQPLADNAENRYWIFNDLCHVTAGPMARIINLHKALTTRFYTRGMSGRRVLKVTDPLLPANQEPIVFRLVDGRAEILPADGASPEIETDIATLTQVLCGYLTARNARQLGRFRTDADTASWLDKIIVDTPLFIPAGDWF
ncbi:MAG: GNAT family N-acetyltransferase [Chloroflexi bacterium]|nr:MAG: GNAT family N-acetyltransferase [Chloroflexota bacterium]